ncbi:response regulator [Halosquirtibacter xylanolyticus]|uniref:response regulator n=1 Tax=Halosquirtibacter xylanolyticus TaxID=3374599 RepID=UPI00374846D3|nr:response regulator [Prolixibacteraceae bacterium]
MAQDLGDMNYLVLVVDDEPVNSMLMNKYLQEMGISCVLASSYTEIIESVKNHDFDLILMDYKLPDRTGIEISDELRVNYPDVRICIQTALECEEITERVENGFFAGFISKPFRRERFYREVRAILKNIQ